MAITSTRPLLHVAGHPLPATAGFSLIELTVVITIVAVTATLLIPVIRMVRSSAKSVYCASHMRQVLIGIEGYGQDNEGFLVSYWIDNRYWFDSLSPYLEANTSAGKLDAKHRNAFYRCPEWNWGGSSHYSNMGYGMCHDNNVGSSNTFWSNWSWVATGNVSDGRIAQLTWPSSRIIIGDSANTYIEALGNVWAYWTIYQYDQSKWLGVSPYAPAAANPVRHGGRANYGFVDGHVKSLGPLISPYGYFDPKRLAE